MEAIIHLLCEGCRAALVVVPASVRELASEDGDDEELEELTGVEGQPFALSDEDGRYACPECGRAARVPRLNLG